MSSFKRIHKSDIFTLPYVANKNWSFTSSSLADNGIVIYNGTKQDTVFDPINDTVTEGYYDKLIFKSINHLFYQEFSGSYINNTGSLQSTNYESSSIYRPSGSYYDYNEWNTQDKYYPTSSGEKIKVLSIPKDVYGSSIKKGTFCLSSSLYFIEDDTKGNLIDTSGSLEVNVGNIFYSHGIAVITNQAYQTIF